MTHTLSGPDKFTFDVFGQKSFDTLLLLTPLQCLTAEQLKKYCYIVNGNLLSQIGSWDVKISATKRLSSVK